MVKNGKKHIESLKDQRQIYLDGELVKNHLVHPAFKESVASIASLYDFQAHADHQELMTFTSPTTGGRVNRAWQLPKSLPELISRRKALEAWSELSCGFLGRSPDHVASAISGMYMGIDVFRKADERSADALADYYQYARDNDLYLSYVIINPQVDKSKTAGNQAQNLIASIVDQDAQGITIHGAKMLGTGCTLANEVFISCIQPLRPGEEQLAFSAAIPLSTKGVKMLSRKSYEFSSVSTFDNPLSSRFDENDAVLFFDQVKIPWERVFVFKDVQMMSAQWHGTPAHVYQNYQCQIRFMVKMRFLLGLARRIAETNGIIEFPAVVETLGQMAAEVSMVEGLVEAMEFSGTQKGEYFVPSSSRLYASNVLTQQLYPKFVNSIRELSGGGLIMVPSSVNDFSNEEIANLISNTQKSPATDSKGRVKLFKLAWDAIGSEFGSRHLQYEMFYSGANMVTRGHSYRNYNWQRSLNMVDQFMAGYDLPKKQETKIPAKVVE